MKIAHLSDVHYCDKYLDEVDRCMAFAADYISKHGADLIILSGDLFDHRLEQNSPALFAAIERVSQLANEAPVLILQGTLSHDAPHAIEIFESVQAAHEIHIADRISQVALSGRLFYRYSEMSLSNDVVSTLPTGSVLISCLPSVNKGHVAAAVGPENAATAMGEQVATLLQSWAPSHREARAAGIPTIVVSHGTVSGSLTEHGVPMSGLDHEFTVGTLFAADASAVMLGHIHKAQEWERDGRRIAYPGSLGRLHFGEHDPKGFLMWEVDADSARYEFIETPAKQLVEIDFPGAPNMDEIARIAKEIPPGAHVRVRWLVDEEHRASVDKGAIAALLEHAAETKLEGRIAPICRQRAAGIGQAPGLEDRLRTWAQLTNTPVEPLLERLALLQAGQPDAMENAA